MRGVTLRFGLLGFSVEISTHTPHARRDLQKETLEQSRYSISTHTPHARRDIEKIMDYLNEATNFNSHASCEA